MEQVGKRSYKWLTDHLFTKNTKDKYMVKCRACVADMHSDQIPSHVKVCRELNHCQDAILALVAAENAVGPARDKVRPLVTEFGGCAVAAQSVVPGLRQYLQQPGRNVVGAAKARAVAQALHDMAEAARAVKDGYVGFWSAEDAVERNKQALRHRIAERVHRRQGGEGPGQFAYVPRPPGSPRPNLVPFALTPGELASGNVLRQCEIFLFDRVQRDPKYPPGKRIDSDDVWGAEERDSALAASIDEWAVEVPVWWDEGNHYFVQDMEMIEQRLREGYDWVMKVVAELE